jgi:hypothetical protein
MCGKYCNILPCSYVWFPPYSLFIIFPAISFVLTKYVWYPGFDSEQIGSTSSDGSAHLLCINVHCFVICELGLIWLLNCQDPIKFLKQVPWPLFPQIVSTIHRLIKLPPPKFLYKQTYIAYICRYVFTYCHMYCVNMYYSVLFDYAFWQLPEIIVRK